MPESAMNKLPLVSTNRSFGPFRPACEPKFTPLAEPATVIPWLFQVALAAQSGSMETVY